MINQKRKELQALEENPKLKAEIEYLKYELSKVTLVPVEQITENNNEFFRRFSDTQHENNQLKELKKQKDDIMNSARINNRQIHIIDKLMK